MTFVQAADGHATYGQQVAALIARTDGVLHPGISCYGCNGYRHDYDECSGATTTNTTGKTHTVWFILAQATEKKALTPTGYS